MAAFVTPEETSFLSDVSMHTGISINMPHQNSTIDHNNHHPSDQATNTTDLENSFDILNLSHEVTVPTTMTTEKPDEEIASFQTINFRPNPKSASTPSKPKDARTPGTSTGTGTSQKSF